MTELAPLNTHADFQLASATTSAHVSHPITNGVYSPAEETEDNYVIRCFCGLSSDDGNTVLCEICNTWQHILCYYPQGNETVPDEHFCVICRPRTFDKRGALERQQNARVLVSPQERKIRKAPSKSHKKKLKDVNSASIQTNGWLSGPDAPNRASGSPREQGPPAKRPKTTHRSSASTSNFAAGHSRKRAGSTTLNGQSPTKSPRSHSPEGYSGDYYSPEFMRSSNAAFQLVTDNTYASINVSNDLRTWLNDPEALRELYPGLSQKDVFTRWDRPIEALKQMSPGVSSCKREDPTMLINGTRPVHRWVEASTSCNKDSYIGELNGLIGRVEDYVADPNNRWNDLRHPEPFVFFHDRLPIFVDCRDEGSVLRHVGRSCQPNVKLQIIIHGTDFHFCFISLRDIAAGEELTVPWHIRDRELELVRTVNDGGDLRSEDEGHISSFFTNVLANFGGCACSRPGNGVICNLARFDLRNKERPYAMAASKTKPRKQKRLPTQISPGSTGRATNSRAGSEAIIHVDNDEEMADSRSLSAKSRSQPSSRDITPMVDGAVGLGVGMSDRERRKLLQQEKLFEKMELDGQSGGRKGKRNSAGSALNTPVPSSSVRNTIRLIIHKVKTNTAQKQLGFPDNPSPTAVNTGFSRVRANGSTPRPVNGTKVHRARPEMVSMPTQTDNDVPMASPSPPRRRTNGSQVSCLLRRVQQESRRRKERSASVMSTGKASPTSTSSTPVSTTKMEGTPSPVMTSMPPPPVPAVLSAEVPKSDPLAEVAAPDEPKDIDMQDVAEAVAPQISQSETMDSDSAPAPEVQPPAEPPSDTPAEPPAPPWPSDKAPSPVDSPTLSRPNHVQLPPVPSFASVPDVTPTPSTEVVQSPLSISGSHPPLLSPSISSSVAPSPAKKKMSLGDWMRQKKEKEAVAKQAREEAVKSDPIDEEEGDKDKGVAVEDVDMPLPPTTTESNDFAEAPATSDTPASAAPTEQLKEVKVEGAEGGEKQEDVNTDAPASTAPS